MTPSGLDAPTEPHRSGGPPGLVRRIWQQPEARFSDAGFSAEMMMAGVRLLVVLLLVYIPADQYIGQGFSRGDLRVLLTAAAAALLGSLAIYSAVNRHWGRSWISFVSSLLDVSLVSGVLALFLVLDQPAQAVQDVAVFPAYFLAIGATSLRYDSRVCLVTGTLAVLQYGAIVTLAFEGVRRGLWPVEEPLVWETQVARLVALAVATVLAVSLVVRARELRTLSSRDRFTGLLNRATFDERLRIEEAVALATAQSFAVGMIDIDHFKRFNDTHGHAGGDAALRQVAAVLRRSFRGSDVVARYGGEEFSVLLLGVGADQSRPLFERIRQIVAGLPIRLPGHPGAASVTVSIGVAVFPEDGASADEVLAVADRRLYEAKAAGRNLVVSPVPARPARPVAEVPVRAEAG